VTTAARHFNDTLMSVFVGRSLQDLLDDQPGRNPLRI
jgi:hypothetical protein